MGEGRAKRGAEAVGGLPVRFSAAGPGSCIVVQGKRQAAAAMTTTATTLNIFAAARTLKLATKVDLSQLETRLTDRLYAVAAGIVGSSNIAVAGVIVALTV